MSGNSPNDQIPEFLQTLGLMLPVSVEDVKQAYRDKVKTSHPDVGGSVEHFNQIQLAFERRWNTPNSGPGGWPGWRPRRAIRSQQALIADLTSQGGIIDIEQLDWLTKSLARFRPGSRPRRRIELRGAEIQRRHDHSFVEPSDGCYRGSIGSIVGQRGDRPASLGTAASIRVLGRGWTSAGHRDPARPEGDRELTRSPTWIGCRG